MVLGAGALQVPLINKVIEKGYNPVVVSLNDSEPGMKMTKDIIVADFVEKELMLQYAIDYHIEGIVSDQTDLPVKTIAYVSDKLNLPSIGYDVACLFTDKFKMREKCREMGINTLEYELVNSYNAAKSFFLNLGKSIILKPINNQGSKGVYLVHSLKELELKYKEAVNYCRCEGLLIEEYVKGEEEIVIEGLAFDGYYENLVCGDTYYFNLPDVFSARQRIFPSIKNENILNQALTLNKTIMKGFGLKRGITHGEYIVSDGKVYLIEIAARGGGVYISSDIIPMITNFDTTSFIIDIATKRIMEKPNIGNNGKVVCYIAFFLPEGIVTSISGVEEIVSKPYLHHNNLYLLKCGKVIKKNTDKTSRFFMVIEAPDYNEIQKRIKNIQNILTVKVLTNNGKEKGIIWN